MNKVKQCAVCLKYYDEENPNFCRHCGADLQEQLRQIAEEKAKSDLIKQAEQKKQEYKIFMEKQEAFEKRMFNNYSWFFGLITLLFSIILLPFAWFIPTIVLLIVALVLLPPSQKLIESKINFKFSRRNKVLMFIASLIMFSIVIENNGNNSASNTETRSIETVEQKEPGKASESKYNNLAPSRYADNSSATGAEAAKQYLDKIHFKGAEYPYGGWKLIDATAVNNSLILRYRIGMDSVEQIKSFNTWNQQEFKTLMSIITAPCSELPEPLFQIIDKKDVEIQLYSYTNEQIQAAQCDMGNG